MERYAHVAAALTVTQKDHLQASATPALLVPRLQSLAGPGSYSLRTSTAKIGAPSRTCMPVRGPL
jgi:hypothetical protein